MRLLDFDIVPVKYHFVAKSKKPLSKLPEAVETEPLLVGYARVSVAAKAFCAEWGYDWDHVAGDSCCSGYSCDGVAPDGEEATYERPSHQQYRDVARRMLKAIEVSRVERR